MFSRKNSFPTFYTYHGRKISKKISPLKVNLINKFYDQYSLDKSVIHYHISKNNCKKINIPKYYNRVNIEIGFGNGEFLIKNATAKPEELFIGIEVYVNGIARVLTSIVENKINNIILSNINSFYFLEAIPFRSVDKIFIINPDPWIKKRHHKRRLVSYGTIKILSEIIKSKNSIYITTDSESYMSDIKDLLDDHKKVIGEYSIRILMENDDLYSISKYQRKAIEKGEKLYQIII